jgi:hypothetical protein
MLVPVQTFRSYGVLLQRLLPQITQALIAGADGTTLWASDPAAETALQSTRMLIQCGTENPADPQCLAIPTAAMDSASAPRWRPAGLRPARLWLALSLASWISGVVHARMKPALDCLQSELSARIPICRTPTRWARSPQWQCRP